MSIDVGKIMRAVAGLGTTPDEIAETLAAEGLVGVRSTGNECPVARYVRKHFGAYGVSIVVAGEEKFFVGATVGGWVAERPTPVQVREFMQNFDQGRYPQLIDGRGER